MSKLKYSVVVAVAVAGAGSVRGGAASIKSGRVTTLQYLFTRSNALNSYT